MLQGKTHERAQGGKASPGRTSLFGLGWGIHKVQCTRVPPSFGMGTHFVTSTHSKGTPSAITMSSLQHGRGDTPQSQGEFCARCQVRPDLVGRIQKGIGHAPYAVGESPDCVWVRVNPRQQDDPINVYDDAMQLCTGHHS